MTSTSCFNMFAQNLPSKVIADEIHFRDNKPWYSYESSVRADDSHEMSSLIFYEKYENESPVAVLIGTFL